ncbi:hypothetical protein OH76DRAFT_1398281 [Lentinus brumalis]|uniref:Uncharacterized protein n=1 Tax=Lentinus brumalis TaxID=2498619 RepID=A0A371DN82_9APHY|nr:hypothetical protein OH76DRAFT_1398281 [Polyporus brumalis]
MCPTSSGSSEDGRSNNAMPTLRLSMSLSRSSEEQFIFIERILPFDQEFPATDIGVGTTSNRIHRSSGN